ncbi:response regulator [Palleronia sp. LCG004]|uniref:response regulator n=1 Tax=Palleronia sp. LCG004 TaxID=3079304 RepID=UPI002942D996|nr:response regulator [Palleronia sp. LCG004]WOI57426.1 response regulator [Palleronia sp. LCG004]
MPDILDEFLFPRRPTAERPLLGQTVLIVEDSRFAGETMRLMCLRGGARIRRADSLRSAARHLKTYRPTIVVVDLGLPDGSGLDLIRQLSAASPRVPALLAVSGDPMQEDAAMRAGADDFLTKPFGSVAAFHAAILSRLPETAQPQGPRIVSNEIVVADPSALGDDYALIMDLLKVENDDTVMAYAASFAINLAHSTGDAELLAAGRAQQTALTDGERAGDAHGDLGALVRRRMTVDGSLAV